jgi:hypothetical protein
MGGVGVGTGRAAAASTLPFSARGTARNPTGGGDQPVTPAGRGAARAHVPGVLTFDDLPSRLVISPGSQPTSATPDDHYLGATNSFCPLRPGTGRDHRFGALPAMSGRCCTDPLITGVHPADMSPTGLELSP